MDEADINEPRIISMGHYLEPARRVSELNNWDDTENREAFSKYYGAYGLKPTGEHVGHT